MELRDKGIIKLRLATTFRKIVNENKINELNNQTKGIKDIASVASLRQLVAASGISFNVLQEIFTGKRDPQFTTLLSAVEGLGINFPQFAAIYNKITDSEIEETKKAIDAGKKKAVKRKQASVRNKT